MANAKKEKKQRNYTFKFLNRFMIIQFILMMALSLFITKKVSTAARENAINNLMGISNERALIVTEFVEEAESKLRLFAANSVVRELVKNPNDAETLKTAQRYNEVFAGEIVGVEGLYIAGWDTMTYTHNVKTMIGNPFRTDEDRIADLQQNLQECGTKIYNAGILKSPSTGMMVLSLYKAVYDDDGAPIGIVGLALNTDRVMEKLENIETVGLEHSTYTMIDVINETYVFDQDDPNNAGQPLQLPDLLRTCEEYRTGKNTDTNTNYEYKLPGMGSFIGASVWLPERNWVLMMNDKKSEVYSLVNAMRMFLGIFTALIFALMILFTILNKKQEKVNLKLVTSMERMNQAKTSLNAAMFSDVLTEVGNRVKLTIALSDATDALSNPYYFAMFNVMDFSSINTAFGNDTGDEVLVRTAELLTKGFPNGAVYRTGSDEFVVMVRSDNGNPRIDAMIASVDNVLRTLIVPQNIEGVGTLYPKYKVAVIKKNTGIDPSVITILKEMTNAKGEAIVGMIDFSDLSE